MRAYDNIEYKSGGQFVDSSCRKILQSDREQIFNLSKEQFTALLEENMRSSLKECEKTNCKNRREINLFDKILISNFWNKKMSNYYLDSVYSIEHIIPFSSIWSKTIDINRLGNLFPTLDIINKTRGNKNLDIYFEDDNRHFTRFIQDLLPIENYNEICSFPAATTAFAAANDVMNVDPNDPVAQVTKPKRKNKTTSDVAKQDQPKKSILPHILSNDKYNEYCRKNEQNYIHTLVNDIFS